MFQGKQNHTVKPHLGYSLPAFPCVTHRQMEAQLRIQDAALVGINQVCLSSLIDIIDNIGSYMLMWTGKNFNLKLMSNLCLI